MLLARLCRMESSRADMSQGIRIPENGYSEQSIQFMEKVMEISGLGDRTFLPDGALLCHCAPCRFWDNDRQATACKASSWPSFT